MTKRALGIDGAHLVVAAALFACSALFPGPSSSATIWGPRVGVGLDPDQFIFGAHFRSGPISDNLYVQPNLELGLGDDVTLFTGSVPLHYYFDASTSAKPYAGLGFSAGFWSHNDNSDFEVSIDLIGGLEWRLNSGKEFFAEFKFGLGDLHDVELMAGWMF